MFAGLASRDRWQEMTVVDWFVDRADRTAPTTLRREIRDYFARHSLSTPDKLADAELIVEELLANAIDHSQGPVWVTLEWSYA